MSKPKANTAKAGALKYDAALHPKQAYKLMLLGATLSDLAKFFELADCTIDRWVATHSEFAEAVKSGGQIADANVAKALYRRAIGYRHKAVKIMSVAGPAGTGSAIERVPYTEVYPPDTVAAIFWLKNRQKEHWREKIQLSNDPENPVSITLNMAGPEAPKKAGK